MINRDKVIKGLELCEIGSGDRCYETECPYYGQRCTESLKNDILALLKEQKIAMKPKNIDNIGGNCPVCGLRMARSHKYCYQCGQEMDWE